MSQDTPQALTVFYDGSCPLCASGISYYKWADTDQSIELVDVSSKRFFEDDRIGQSEAMARFHVRLADGQQMSGARAFVEVWRVILGWRWLARFANPPGAVFVLEAFYRLFRCIRPLIICSFSAYLRIFGRYRARWLQHAHPLIQKTRSL